MNNNTINTRNLTRKELVEIGELKIVRLGMFLQKHCLRNEDTKHINRKIFHLLRHPYIYVNAYTRISKNSGALTKGYQDEDMMRYFGLSDAKTLATAITNGTYKFAPTKRTWIPKPGKKKKRPLDVPKQSDRIVQEAIRGILEAIYEPIFKQQGVVTNGLSNNYGFRPNLSTWSAIQKIKNNSESCNMVIEGDISSAFNHVDHDILINILRKRITDKKFLKLIKNLLECGVMDGEQFEHSLAGTPQGGIVSPLLFNIYMLGFDQYVYEHIIDPLHKSHSGAKNKLKTKEYNHISHQFQLSLKRFRILRKSLPTPEQKTQLKLAYRELRSIRAQRNSTQYGQVKTIRKRAVYVRYADDWVLLLTCTRQEAEALKTKIADFILTKRKMTLDVEKTKITQFTEGFNFLGFNIRLEKSNKQLGIRRKTPSGYNRILQRSMARVVQITPDHKRIIKRLKQQNMVNNKGIATANPKFLGSSNYEIVTKYNMILRDLVNYYEPCGKFGKLYQISYFLRYSCARTLARRRKTTMSKIFLLYGKDLHITVGLEDKPTLKVNFEDIKHLRANINKRPDKKYLNIRPTLFDPFRLVDYWRTKFKLYVECCICGEREDVSLFRTRITRNTDVKTQKLTDVLIKFNRLQIPVCVSCNELIVKGKYEKTKPYFSNRTIAKL